MDKLVIEGGRRLEGTVTISGAKNACLPILAATLLSDEKSVIRNIPSLRDIATMLKILKNFGARVVQDGDVIIVEPKGYTKYTAPYELVSTMRASICVLGPLLAKHKKAEVSFPGGCIIGPRPIDIHLKGLTALNAKLKVERGYIIADGSKMRGAHIYLGGHFGSSVLATANVMMAATLTKGVTIIENAACEPEVMDLSTFLVKMGARIKGYGSHRIIIEGVKKLHGADHSVIPDRIEAGTLMCAAAITKGEVLVRGVHLPHVESTLIKLKQAGVEVLEEESGVRIKAPLRLRATDIKTQPFPGFPTDMQSQLVSLLSLAEGTSVVTESVFENRFMHVHELKRMGADIRLEGSSAIITGVPRLQGAPVKARDLRAGAALMIAGMAAEGETLIEDIDRFIERGYDKLDQKLRGLGADIRELKNIAEYEEETDQ